MDLITIATELNTEDKCLAYLEKIRWPEGVRCIQCGGEKISKIVTAESKRKNGRKIPARRLYECLNPECAIQFTAKAGTLFNDSHLPLTKWFLAVALIKNAKKGMSARQLERDLKVSHQTAWHLYHRIRESMLGNAEVFAGTIEMDEVFIGGRFDPRRHNNRNDNKTAVVGVLQRGQDGQPSRVQATPVAQVAKETIQHIVAERVSFDAAIYTDEGSHYRHLAKTRKHEIVIHSKGEYARGEVHVNSLEGFWSLVKRQIIGQHHWVSVKHLQSYLNERAYVFNHRKEEDLFALIIAALAIGAPLPYSVLTADVEPSDVPAE